jgi:hypothetical protein
MMHRWYRLWNCSRHEPPNEWDCSIEAEYKALANASYWEYLDAKTKPDRDNRPIGLRVVEETRRLWRIALEQVPQLAPIQRSSRRPAPKKTIVPKTRVTPKPTLPPPRLLTPAEHRRRAASRQAGWDEMLKTLQSLRVEQAGQELGRRNRARRRRDFDEMLKTFQGFRSASQAEQAKRAVDRLLTRPSGPSIGY